MKNKYAPAILLGFAAGVVNFIPGMRTFGCCIIVPSATIAALYIHQRINGFDEQIKINHALLFGLITGIFSAIFSTTFDTLLTFITKTNQFVENIYQMELALKEFNLQEFSKDVTEVLYLIEKDIKTSGFSIIYTFVSFFNNLFMDIIFGLIGGIIGMSLINKRKQN